MYYTIMPPHFESEDKENELHTYICRYKNHTVEVASVRNQLQLQRIFSTDLQVYLEKDLQPGKILDVAYIEKVQ
ncbi:MAG: hypothetical protein GX962_16380 [Epulopiscium sp.]|nr:hypothetical protein [Candidatus Epulonipiscium sp.]